jgi:hypothetical protein
MAPVLSHPFPLRLTPEERSALDRVFEAYNHRATSGLPNRTTRTDVARMALDRGLQLLLLDLNPRPPADLPAPSGNQLPHDEGWMKGGLQVAGDLLPPYDWGATDPARDGDPILPVAGRGAYIIR